MSYNYSNKELNEMSRDEYQNLQSNPWNEKNVDNLFLPETVGMGSFGENTNMFEQQGALDNVMSSINNGPLKNMHAKQNKLDEQEQLVIFNTTSTDATKGILEETLVTKILFSPKNIEALQNSIRYYVFKKTNKNISNQSDEQLYIIIRAIALQFGNFVVPDPLKEVNRLNMMIIDRCVNNIVVELVEYDRYVNDLSKLPIPLENPHYANKNNFTYDLSNLPE